MFVKIARLRQGPVNITFVTAPKQLKIVIMQMARLRSRTGQHHFYNSCQTHKNNPIIKQRMHAMEVNIRMCQPSKVMFTEVNITLSGRQILVLISVECLDCIMQSVRQILPANTSCPFDITRKYAFCLAFFFFF